LLARIVAAFAFGYFLSYLFRVVNAVAGAGHVAADIGVDAGALGLLTSVYFLTFAAVQLPLGVALDRYGPRLVESLLLIVAAIGAAVFATAAGLPQLVLGRGLIGIGVAAGLMAAFKAYTMTVPHKRLPFVNGIHMAAGGLGALAAGAPAEYMIDLVGWRGLFVALAALSLVAAALIVLLGPKGHPAPAAGDTLRSQVRSVGGLLADPVFLRVAAFCVPSQATALAIQGLWAGPWLRDVQELDPRTAAAVLSLMAAAMIAGFLVFGWMATRAHQRDIPTLHVAIAGMSVFMLAQAALILLPAASGAIVWCVYAFFATAGILLFPALAAFYPRELAGRVNTALNFLVFTSSFAIQWLVGVGLDAFGGALGLKGAYDAAFGVLLALQVAGLALLLSRMPTVPAPPQSSAGS
jgi:MFS family permease